MTCWAYEIHDNETDSLLMFDAGFDTESDAEIQGTMDAKAENIKNYYIRTFQILDL